MTGDTTTAGTQPRSASGKPLIDPRGPRFGAGITTVVLAVVLILAPSPAANVLLAIQLLVFGIGAAFGLARAPYGLMYRSLVRPRLGPPPEWEEEAPPRFAQAVGFAFAAVGLAGFLLGWTAVGYIAVAMALAAAFLNVAFAYCLGCETYLLLARLRRG